MSATQQYIQTLTDLKPGDLGLLRTHAGKKLDQSVLGFDLFAGLWWPLRQKNQWAPRREVAWLIAKLYAFCPIDHTVDHTLARQLRRCWHDDTHFQERVDRMLTLPVADIELSLQWALDRIADDNLTLDWVKLTDDLSTWNKQTTRLRWANQFLGIDERD